MLIVNAGGELKELIEAKKVVIVDFWAEWCIPCKVVEESLRRLSHVFNREEISFVKVNVGEYPELAAEFRVFSLPTVIIFVNGEEVKRFIGIPRMLELKIKEILERYVS